LLDVDVSSLLSSTLELDLCFDIVDFHVFQRLCIFPGNVNLYSSLNCYVFLNILKYCELFILMFMLKGKVKVIAIVFLHLCIRKTESGELQICYLMLFEFYVFMQQERKVLHPPIHPTALPELFFCKGSFLISAKLMRKEV